MCDGLKELERVTEQLGQGYVSEFALVQTCEEHEGMVIGFGAIFSPTGEVMEGFEPVLFDGDDGRVEFLDLVSRINLEASISIDVLSGNI